MAHALGSVSGTMRPDGVLGLRGTQFPQGLNDLGRMAHRYLLMLRFALLNVTALALVGAAALQGWLTTLLAADSTHLVKLIIVVFVVGLAQCGLRTWKLSTELNELKQEWPSEDTRAGKFLRSATVYDSAARAALASSLKLKLVSRLQSLRYIAGLLVLLGLIGTVVGFIIALSGVNPATVSDVNAIGPMVTMLLSGMAVALHTTLVGSLLNVWLTMNCRLVETGTVHFYTSLVELGERHARP